MLGFRFLGATIALIALGACNSGPRADPIAFVDLTHRQPLSAVFDTEVTPLRIAVAAIISPEGTAESYQGLADYLGAQLGRPTQLVQRRTYAEVNDLIADQVVDLAFVCTSAYVAGHADFGMELLVAPEIDGESVYYSVLIVPIDSDVEDMAELQGRVFAFTDPMSHTGRVYPTFLVQQLEEKPETFFAEVFFTYGHDRAIQAVADGIADGAAVDSLVLDHAIQRDPTLGDRIRIIHQSPPFGIPPVVVSPDLSPRWKLQLREILLSLGTNPSGRQILTDLGIDHFVAVSDEAYDGVRLLADAVEAGA